MKLFSDADAEFLDRVAVRLDIINGDRISDETIKLRAMAGAIRKGAVSSSKSDAQTGK